MADAGFLIDGRLYAFPTTFRVCDPVLVSKLTGMTWAEWVEAAEDTDSADPAATAGMLGVAIWQGNPTWTRDKVIRYVEHLDLAAIVVNNPEADALPPAEAGTPSPSNGSLEQSNREPSSLSGTTATPLSTGTPASDISSPASLQAV